MRPRILIKGAGEHSSGTAHRLFRCGYPVVMTEVACPRAVRRTVSFCDAVFQGTCLVEGVPAQLCALEDAATLDGLTQHCIPVLVDPQASVREPWRPDVIIDGRILKRNLDNARDQAALTIGFGPGLEAGRDVHFVVETQRGHDLGRIIGQGRAAPDSGVPGTIAGYGAQRVLRAPCAGELLARRDIGDLVQQGELLGTVAGQELRAAIPGLLRGLVRPGSQVLPGQKIGDIDPRGERGYCQSISDKARTISGAALEIILRWERRVARG